MKKTPSLEECLDSVVSLEEAMRRMKKLFPNKKPLVTLKPKRALERDRRLILRKCGISLKRKPSKKQREISASINLLFDTISALSGIQSLEIFRLTYGPMKNNLVENKHLLFLNDVASCPEVVIERARELEKQIQEEHRRKLEIESEE